MAPPRILSNALIAGLLTTANAACYFPNGTNRNLNSDSNHFDPINPDATHSMCCRFEGYRPVDTPSQEHPGLCQVNTNHGILTREACTDPTWAAPECLKLCVGGYNPYTPHDNDPMAAANDVTITPCDDGSYCCYGDATGSNCCANKKGMFLVNGIATTALPTASATPTTGAMSNPSRLRPRKRKLGGGAIAGIVIASVLGVLLVLAVLYLVSRRRKASSTTAREGTDRGYYDEKVDLQGAAIHEAEPGHVRAHEAEANPVRAHEMPDPETVKQRDALAKASPSELE